MWSGVLVVIEEDTVITAFQDGIKYSCHVLGVVVVSLMVDQLTSYQLIC